MSFASIWMPLFGDDLWESERVAAMDGDAGFLYLWLLWRQFKHGSLPPPEMLRRLPHRWQAQWDVVWPQVASCFDVLPDGRLENPKCAEVRAAALVRSRKASTNGRRGGRPTKEHAESERKATAKLPVSGSKADGKLTQSSERRGEEKRGEEKSRREVPVADAPDANLRLVDAPQADPDPPKPRTAHAEVIAWFSDQYLLVNGKQYAFEGKKDGEAVKKLLERAGDGGAAEVLERGLLFFADQYHRKTGLTLTKFLSAWNALLKPVRGAGGGGPTMRDILAGNANQQPREVRAEVIREAS